MPYPVALAATLLVEVPVYLTALVAGGAWGWPRALTAAVAVNLATHPLAWLLLSGPTAVSWGTFLVVECGVWLVESGLLLGSVRRDPALITVAALTANLGSCLLGVGAAQLGW